MFQDLLTKFSDREKKILYYGAIPAWLVAFFYLLFFGPVMNKLDALHEQRSRQEDIVRGDLLFLKYDKERIQKEIEALSKYFVQKQQDVDVINAEFLSVVEGLATLSNVNLVKSNPAETEKEKYYSKYFANLDCEGKLEDVIAFLHRINSSNELLKVVRFNMSSKRGSPDVVNVSMTVAKLIVSSGEMASK